VERFRENLSAYKSPQCNEARLRKEFLDPFFKEPGWDMENKEGYSEAYKEVAAFFGERIECLCFNHLQPAAGLKGARGGDAKLQKKRAKFVWAG
jgi:hypothetical protein